MKIIVQKYGGTSVDTPEKRGIIAEKAKDVINRGALPVIVVSAMGRYPSPYATDSLFTLIDKEVADERSKDMLISCGEIISSVVVSEALKDRGLNCAPLTGALAGIITKGEFGEAQIDRIDPMRIYALLEEGIVPIVAGFQGQNEEGQIQTLGRGGSDTTAAALGEYLKAQAIEIYTDVAGVMSADPKTAEAPILLEKLNYDDVFIMAEAGAKVIHPRAVTHAKRGGVPLCVMDTASPRSAPHTVISNEPKAVKGSFIAVTHSAFDDEYSLVSVIAAYDDKALEREVAHAAEECGLAYKDMTFGNKVIAFKVAANDAKRAVGFLHKKLIG